MKSVKSEPSPYTSGVNECDTDADICCLGKNFIVYKYTRRTADVYAFDKSYAPSTNIPIVTGATAYDDPYQVEHLSSYLMKLYTMAAEWIIVCLIQIN